MPGPNNSKEKIFGEPVATLQSSSSLKHDSVTGGSAAGMTYSNKRMRSDSNYSDNSNNEDNGDSNDSSGYAKWYIRLCLCRSLYMS